MLLKLENLRTVLKFSCYFYSIPFQPPQHGITLMGVCNRIDFVKDHPESKLKINITFRDNKTAHRNFLLP